MKSTAKIKTLDEKANKLIGEAARLFRAIKHPFRQQIITFLRENPNTPTVTDIFVKLRVEQSAASQHLAILRRTNIINCKRDGKFIYYTVNENRIADIIKFAEQLEPSPIPKIG